LWRKPFQTEAIDKMALCSSIQLRISPDRIHYLKFILEGYDGLAILSTLNARQGIVEVRYPPEAEKDLAVLLTEINAEIIK
jgi:hypothetical protein